LVLEEAAQLAGRIGDGLVSTAPKAEIVEAYEDAGGDGPKIGQLTVCWAESEAEARKTAFEEWPNAALQGPLGQELPLPSHFGAAAQIVDENAVAEAVVCGPDADRHLHGIQHFADAGFEPVCVHQVGSEQEGFVRFYEREVLPQVGRFHASSRGKPLAA
jgi:G6PDH family F420-dependent oxidoreductase